MKIVDLRHPPKGLLEFSNSTMQIWFYVNGIYCLHFYNAKKITFTNTFVSSSTKLYYNGEKIQ